MADYNTLHYDGSECTKQRAYVRMYPNTSYEEDQFLQSGDDIPSALHSALSQLYSYGSISYYALQQFNTTDYNYPDLNVSSTSDFVADFRSFLENGSKNGTGSNLKDGYIGVHLLVHSSGCNTDLASAEYADDCGWDDYHNEGDYSAFSRGTMAWTGSECQFTSGLRKNSAIQEPLHCFIRYNTINHDLTDDNDNPSVYNEHRLGEVRDFNVTPMLTYHSDESSQADDGDCYGDFTSKDGYTQQLTNCTKKAVKQTANDQCITQSTPSWCDNIQSPSGSDSE